MAFRVKTAISLPQEYFNKIEKIKKQIHKSRSQIISEAIYAWLKNQEISKLESQYVEGYKKNPENISELELFHKAGLDSLGKEKW